MSSTKVKVIEVDMQRIDQLIERLEQGALSAEDRETVENIVAGIRPAAGDDKR